MSKDLQDKLLYGDGEIAMPPLPKEQPAPEPTAPEVIEEPEVPVDAVMPVDEVAEAKAPEPKEDVKAQNFKAVRDRAAALEKERNEMARKIAELEARTNPQVSEEDDNFDIAADDLAEGKHLKKVASKIKRLEQQLSNYQQQSQVNSVEMRLKQQYADFDKVVSAENIETLRIAYPELANTINSSTDLYSKAVSAYTLIKKLGIEPEDNYVTDRAKAQANAAKPRPLVSVSPQQGDSPLSRANAFANGLTDDLQKQLIKEMNESRKGY